MNQDEDDLACNNALLIRKAFGIWLRCEDVEFVGKTVATLLDNVEPKWICWLLDDVYAQHCAVFRTLHPSPQFKLEPKLSALYQHINPVGKSAIEGWKFLDDIYIGVTHDFERAGLSANGSLLRSYWEKHFADSVNGRKEGEWFGKKTLTVFGSNRCADAATLSLVENVVRELVGTNRWTVLSSGGEGVPSVAHLAASPHARLAFRVGLPHTPATPGVSEQTRWFNSFTERKNALIEQADAFLVAPGGFGTMDELFECLTLIQIGHLTPRPIVLLAPPTNSIWNEFYKWTAQLVEQGLLRKDDLSLLSRCNTSAGAVTVVDGFYKNYRCLVYDSKRQTLDVETAHIMTPSRLAVLRRCFPHLEFEQNEVGFAIPRLPNSSLARHFRYVIDVINNAALMGLDSGPIERTSLPTLG